MKLKKIFLCGIFAASLSPAATAQTVIEPEAAYERKFAIITDTETYGRTRHQMHLYRQSVEARGLAAFIIHDTWNDPDHVRGAVIDLKGSHPGLEGIVLIGDVPVVLVRGGQHLTTAFKMDQAVYPPDRSSVASDRFYDDLKLRFEFVARDEHNPLHYYYELSPDSPQRLDPDLYSGRVMYPDSLGGDKYQAISDYLAKVCREKQAAGELQTLVTYAGDHYNSDDLTVWLDEAVTIREQFPQTIRDSRSLRRLNFWMDRNVKPYILDELERPEVDMFIFNEHGSIDVQHVTREMPATGADGKVEQIRSTVYYYMKREAGKENGSPDSVRRHYQQQYDLTDDFFAGYEDYVQYEEPKDLYEIISAELPGRDLQPRVVVLHACYNGSFQKPDNIASYYLFNRGRTVALQANSVNVLQDKWATEMIGLLSAGASIGQWNRLVPTLECNVIGDPTFAFRPSARYDVSPLLGAEEMDEAFWRGGLDTDVADIVSLSLRKLVDMGAVDSEFLVDFMRECPFATARLECLKLLARLRDDNLREGILLGLYDAWEPVRRNAVIYARQSGDPELCEALADIWANYPESERAAFSAQLTFRVMPPERMAAAAKSALETSLYPNRKEIVADAARHFEKLASDNADHLAILRDGEASDRKRMSEVRTIRNNPYHRNYPHYVDFMKDESNSPELRVAMAEALGWFDKSYLRHEILAACSAYLPELETASPLGRELTRTVARLK